MARQASSKINRSWEDYYEDCDDQDLSDEHDEFPSDFQQEEPDQPIF